VLPSLSVRARRLPRLRAASGAAALVLTVMGFATSVVPTPEPDAPAASLAERLAPSSWAFAVPTSWFAAPVTGIRPGDRIDILSLRAAERPSAAAIAFDLEVMSVDDRVLVLGVSALDATAIATARAAGQLIVPLLRSGR
jgi:hypothetical protein